MPFWDSASTQTSARTVAARPRAPPLVDHDLDGVRDLLEGPAQDLLADELGQQDAQRLVGTLSPRRTGRAPRASGREVIPERRDTLAGARGDREDVVAGLQLGRGLQRRRGARPVQAVDLVDRDDDRQARAARAYAR
jgi:hypothetical protein